jgi:hypothetical protein
MNIPDEAVEANTCPVCGRFMKVTREPIFRVDGSDSGQIRTIRECTNKKVDHDFD